MSNEELARLIYGAITWGAEHAEGKCPAWTTGGNSNAQNQARHIAGDVQEMLEQSPVPLILNCPACGERHIDEGEFATKVHHTHACQGCGLPWRPAKVPTVGVQFLPGYKNALA